MIHPRIFRQSVFLTVLFQFVLAVAAVLSGVLSGDLLLCARLLIALGGGYFYGADYDGGLSPSATGGALCGGLSLLPAIILTVSAGVDAGSMMLVATGACMLAGGAGGLLGGCMASHRRNELR